MGKPKVRSLLIVPAVIAPKSHGILGNSRTWGIGESGRTRLAMPLSDGSDEDTQCGQHQIPSGSG